MQPEETMQWGFQLCESHEAQITEPHEASGPECA
jgi:hypothetical protein